jgi:hypothetical protein
VHLGEVRLEIPIRRLFPNPLQKWLQQRVLAKLVKSSEFAIERAVVERRVDLLVAWLAERHAVFGLSASRFGLEVMKRDQSLRHQSAAEVAAFDVIVVSHAAL